MTASPALSDNIRPGRLFGAACCALAVNGVMVAVIGDVVAPLKERFVLTNQQGGWVNGAQIWGVAISILIFGPLCDAIGMRVLLRLALLGHIAGAGMMMFANGFASLFVGSALMGWANGLVQAACNPLVTTLYPDRKTEKMNHFMAWFPGGIVLGGLVAYAFGKLEWGTGSTGPASGGNEAQMLAGLKTAAKGWAATAMSGKGKPYEVVVSKVAMGSDGTWWGVAYIQPTGTA